MRGAEGKNREAAEALRKLGVKTVELDVSDDTSVEAGVETVLAEAGKIDVLVNNAGIASAGVTEAFTTDRRRDLRHECHRAASRHPLCCLHATAARWPDHQHRLDPRPRDVPLRRHLRREQVRGRARDSLRYEVSQLGVEVVEVQPSGYPTNFFTNLQIPAGIEITESYGEVGHIPDAMVTSLTATFEGKTPESARCRGAIVKLVGQAKGTALSAPSSARRSARPGQRGRRARAIQGGRGSVSAISTKSPDQPPNERKSSCPVRQSFSFGVRRRVQLAPYDWLVATVTPFRAAELGFAESSTLRSSRRSSTNSTGQWSWSAIPTAARVTVAGSSDKVAGLVYVAGVAPDEGESVNDLQDASRRSRWARSCARRSRPTAACGVDRPRAVPRRLAPTFPTPTCVHGDLAAVTATAFDDPDRRCLADEAVLGGVRHRGTRSHRAPPLSYDRTGSTVTEVEGASHFLMLSQPDIVAGVIREAVNASTVTWRREWRLDPGRQMRVETPARRRRKRRGQHGVPGRFESRFPPARITNRSTDQRAESAAAAKLAEDGHLVRLWRRPLVADFLEQRRSGSAGRALQPGTARGSARRDHRAGAATHHGGRHQPRHRPRPARGLIRSSRRRFTRTVLLSNDRVTSQGAQGDGDAGGIAGVAARANDL
jgi:hypothetical protein